jgi:endonuclease/exonuclease/phosphatase family metal-dependent hydrolase
MKIATYNVRNLFDPGTYLDDRATDAVDETFFNQRIAYLIEYFKNLDLDIICLQEIGGEKGVALIGEALSYDYFFAKPNKRGIRMAVMYKKGLADMITCESVSLGELSIPSIVTNGDTDSLAKVTNRRDVLVIDVAYQGKRLRIVTFHLKSLLPEYFEGDDIENDRTAHVNAKFRCILYKMLELRALRTLADRSLDEGRDVIFLGDFNDNNNSSGLDILKSSNKEECMLYDVLVGYDGDKTTHIHRGNRLSFDTMLVSSKVKEMVEEVHVENKTLKDYSILGPGEIEHELESDHALVYITIK